jgi:hypothetical protein
VTFAPDVFDGAAYDAQRRHDRLVSAEANIALLPDAGAPDCFGASAP